MISQYSKLIAAVIGLVLVWLRVHGGVDLGDDAAQKITDAIIMIVTAASVYGLKNKTA